MFAVTIPCVSIDCAPEGINITECQARGCIWSSVPNTGQAACSFPVTENGFQEVGWWERLPLIDRLIDWLMIDWLF